MARRSGRGRIDLGLKVNVLPSAHLYSRNQSYYAGKSDFLHFTCIINEGVARGSRRGHRDLGPKINKMPSANLYLSNE